MEAQKWIVRIDKLYAEYAKMKMGPDFINKEDLQIVQAFNKKNVKDDAVMEFIAKNLETYMNKLGEAPGVEHGVLTIDLPKLSLEEIKKAERTIEIK